MPAVPVLRGPAPVIQLNGEPQGLPNKLNDCFINAILQLLAGGYAQLFDPEENSLGRNESTELQGVVHQVLRKIRGKDPGELEDPDKVGDDEIMLLRDKLLFHNLVKSQWGQEDASELLTVLLDVVTDLSGRFLQVIQKGDLGYMEVDDGESLDKFAKRVGMEVPVLIGINNDLRLLARFHFTEVEVRTINKSEKLEKSSGRKDLPEYIDSERALPPLSSPFVDVPIETYNSLEEFLYYRYGVGEKIEYDEDDEFFAMDNDIAVRVSEISVAKRFLKLPGVMTFMVRRSSVNEEGERIKIEKEFHMPEHLVLVEKNLKGTSYKAYTLTGIAEHISFIHGEMSSGHYVAHIKGEKQWHTANDRSVKGSEKVTESKDLGYIYTYKLSKDLGADRSGLENVPQEDKPKETEKQPSSRPGLRWPLPGKKREELGAKPGVTTTDYLGLPNIPRAPGKDKEARKTDCFINAVVQIMAGPYWPLFDPKKHHIQFDRERAIQSAVWGLILKIHKIDTTAPSGKDIQGLRELLLKEGIVERMVLHEDASQVMLMLLQRMMDLQQYTIYLPGEERIPENAIELDRGATLTEIALMHKCSVKDLETWNTLIDPAGFGFAVHTTQTAGLDTAMEMPDKHIKGDEAEYTGGKRTRQSSGPGIIAVDIVNFNTFHQFLYSTYGGGSVETHLGVKDIQRIVNTTDKGSAMETSHLYIKNFSQKSSFTALPRVLTFYLQRFRQDERQMKKDSRKFDMPESMVLVENNTKGKTYKEYTLKAEAIHSGGIGGGHYTANVKQKGQWYGFDDAAVTKRDSVESDLDTGYIYTYTLVGQYAVLPKEKVALQERIPQTGLKKFEDQEDLTLDFTHNLLIYTPAQKDIRHILNQLEAGPLSRARTKLGLQAVRNLKAMVEKIGMISADDQEGLSNKLLPVIEALAQLKKDLGIEDLRDALVRRRIPQVVVYLDFNAARKVIRGYPEELHRQLALHQAYINNLPLDEWHLRLDLFNATKPERLQDILQQRSVGYQESMHDELIDRARFLLQSRRKSVKKETVELILKDLEAKKKEGDLSILKELTKRVIKPGSDKDISFYRALIGRVDTGEANQPRWAKPGSQSRDRFVAAMKKGWDKAMYQKVVMIKKTRKKETRENIAVLHKPDQVAGGERFLPEVEPKNIEKFIGSGTVNSDIGSAWGGKFQGKTKVGAGAAELLRAHMLKTYPEASWAVLLTNFKLVIRWSDKKEEDVGPAKKFKRLVQTKITDLPGMLKRKREEPEAGQGDKHDKAEGMEEEMDTVMDKGLEEAVDNVEKEEQAERLTKKPKIEKSQDDWLSGWGSSPEGILTPEEPSTHGDGSIAEDGSTPEEGSIVEESSTPQHSSPQVNSSPPVKRHKAGGSLSPASSLPKKGVFGAGITKTHKQTGIFEYAVEIPPKELMAWRKKRPWWNKRNASYDPVRKQYINEWSAWKKGLKKKSI